METCEVTFDDTTPCRPYVFELVGLDQMGQTIFVEEEHDDAYWVDPEPTPSNTPVEPGSSTLADGPDPTSSTTCGLLEPAPAKTSGVEAAIEGEATSSCTTPWHVPRDHPPQQMIGNI